MSKFYKFAFEFLGLLLFYGYYLLLGIFILVFLALVFILISEQNFPLSLTQTLRIPIFVLFALLFRWLAKGTLKREKLRTSLAILLLTFSQAYSFWGSGSENTEKDLMSNNIRSALDFDNFISLLVYIAIAVLILIAFVKESE